MTLVVSLCLTDRIICFADSRIYDPSEGVVLSDTTPKIYSFSARAEYSVYKPRRQFKRWETDVGFAFAGSTLMANSIFALGSSLCRNIYFNKTKRPPSFEFFAELFRYAFEKVANDMNARRQPDKWVDCECIIFGWCLSQKRLRGFGMGGRLSDQGYETYKKEYTGHPLGLALGATEAFNSRMAPLLARYEITGEKPKVSEVFLDILNDRTIPSVGGSIQFCEADRKGVWIRPALDPRARQVKLFGVSVDDFFNYSSVYTVGDVAVGAPLDGF